MSTMADDVRGGGHGAQGRGAQHSGAPVQVGESTPGRRDDSLHREAVREYEASKRGVDDTTRAWADASHQRAVAKRVLATAMVCLSEATEAEYEARRSAMAARDRYATAIRRKAATER